MKLNCSFFFLLIVFFSLSIPSSAQKTGSYRSRAPRYSSDMKRFAFYVLVAILTFTFGTALSRNSEPQNCDWRVRQITPCVSVSEKFNKRVQLLQASDNNLFTRDCICPEIQSNQSCKIIYKIIQNRDL